MDVPVTDRRRTTAVVVGIALLAVAIRLTLLGRRVFHWDEARVGYWILQYVATGTWSYRPILHGPFLFHVNAALFSLLGPTDFVARSVVALVGGALPLAALLFRERLDRIEVVALALFLALNPVLVYYSRFMRNDVLAAGFALIALGLFVRLADTGRGRYLYAGAGFLALAATTKEILLVYLGLWGGTLALLLDNRLLAARLRGAGWRPVIHGVVDALSDRLRRWAIPLTVALLEFVAIVALFYAPRPDLYRAIANPALLPSVLRAGTVGAWTELWGQWVAASPEHSYVAYLAADLRRLAATSLPVVAFGVGGFLADRYARRRPRDVVTIGFGWALATVVVYPAITDISAPWALVHVVVPLAIPAAAGVGRLVDLGASFLADRDRLGTLAVAAIVFLAAAQVGATVYQTSFAEPQAADNPLVQYGQPGSWMQETLADVERIAATNAGTDVRFYGDHFYVANESNPRGGPNWTNRFPLTWYLARANASIESTKRLAAVTGEAPIVIARAEHYAELAERLEGYDARTFAITATNTETVVFVDRSALADGEG
ncbi:MAG: flippase activity-associated protein Agl23 [Halanaeroarchaeum sp.]